ncbi:hypothetical protein [Bacillus massiliigorillae]|uniref:hypothetical protein n=1 Tax=Bacillus massiliigorillae TaxID=1243664 RepID=UPI0003A42916|nr:hypothetical protein [Bacillus massiliigorillae]
MNKLVKYNQLDIDAYFGKVPMNLKKIIGTFLLSKKVASEYKTVKYIYLNQNGS